MIESRDTQLAAASRETDLSTAMATRLRKLLRRWLVRDGIVLAIFFALALLTIAPIVPAMGSRIIGGRGDNVQHIYMTGWMARALLLGQSPFYDPHLNYPDGLELVTTDVPYSSILVAAPLTWLSGPIFGYNAIIWLSALLSGYFAYLWVLSITDSRFGAWVAGAAFLLTPYRVGHSYGHLNLTATYALPLFFWALDHASRLGARSRQLLLLAGATFLVGSNSQYYLVICTVTGAVYALLAIHPRAWLHLGWRPAAGVLVGGVASALPYLWASESRSFQAYDILATRFWSADPLNFLLPSPLHPLWGALFESLRPERLWLEKTLYVGAVALVLAVAGLCWRRNPHRRQAMIWMGCALIGMLFALGTDLHINNQPLQPDAPFWLPAYYLSFLPGTDLMRVWARFGIVTILFVALLAGLAAGRIAAQRWHGHTAILAIIAALLIIDMLPGWPETALLEPRPVELWLARQPGDFAVAFLPAGLDNYGAMFGSLFHGKYLPGFTHPQHLPRAFREFVQRASTFPKPSSIAALRQSGLRYLLVDRKQFNGKRLPPWSEIQRALSTMPGIKMLEQYGDFVVVELT